MEPYQSAPSASIEIPVGKSKTVIPSDAAGSEAGPERGQRAGENGLHFLIHRNKTGTPRPERFYKGSGVLK